jgi:hypothetical protein
MRLPPRACAIAPFAYMIPRLYSKRSPMFRLACILIVPFCFLIVSCDNNTQEDSRWDSIYKDLDSGGKIQPWKDAQQTWNNEGHGKNWN